MVDHKTIVIDLITNEIDKVNKNIEKISEDITKLSLTLSNNEEYKAQLMRTLEELSDRQADLKNYIA